MGLMDRLRAMFGGSSAEEQTPRADEIKEELAVEHVQHDIEDDRNAAVVRSIETPSALDDER